MKPTHIILAYANGSSAKQHAQSSMVAGLWGSKIPLIHLLFTKNTKEQIVSKVTSRKGRLFWRGRNWLEEFWSLIQHTFTIFLQKFTFFYSASSIYGPQKCIKLPKLYTFTPISDIWFLKHSTLERRTRIFFQPLLGWLIIEHPTYGFQPIWISLLCSLLCVQITENCRSLFTFC